MEIVGGLGGLLFLIGWIWLIIIAFQKEGALWGILNVFGQPIMGVIYALVKKAGMFQVFLMLIGLALMVVGLGSTLYEYFTVIFAKTFG